MNDLIITISCIPVEKETWQGRVQHLIKVLPQKEAREEHGIHGDDRDETALQVARPHGQNRPVQKGNKISQHTHTQKHPNQATIVEKEAGDSRTRRGTFIVSQVLCDSLFRF